MWQVKNIVEFNGFDKYAVRALILRNIESSEAELRKIGK